MKTIWDAIVKLFKAYFISGLMVVVPLVVTIWVVKVLIIWADDFIFTIAPTGLRATIFAGKAVPGAGIVITVALILFAGFITRMYLGKKLLSLGDSLITKIPLGRGIYNGVKQVMGTLLSKRGEHFKGVVFMNFPMPEYRTLGFITGSSKSPSGVEIVRIFVPTAPNPTSGFLVYVESSKVVMAPYSVEEAMKLIISGGIVG